MLKLSDAVRTIVENNALLQMGLKDRLLNLSQIARYLQPQVEARLAKSVQTSAIVMNLSRLQNELQDRFKTAVTDFKVQNITVHSNLCVVTFAKTKEVHKAVSTVAGKVLRHGGYMTITEGIREVTVIVTKDHVEDVTAAAVSKPVDVHSDISSLSVTFEESYLEIPGLFYLIFQQLYFQNINIIELASTANELILYLKQDDVRLAFETIYGRFTRR